MSVIVLFFGLLTATALSGTGAIEGRVTFTGTPPPPIVLTQDGSVQPVLYVSDAGGLRYAVVYLPDAPRDDAPPATAVARMNQRNFIFEPQVLAVRARQPVQFTSDDPANHNVRANDAGSGNRFNLDTATGAAASNIQRFATTGGQPVQLSCDIHPWMAAWVYAFDHDLFAVTDVDGSFRIQNVPSGRHRLAIRQPSGRLARDLTIDVRPGETSRLEVTLLPADIGRQPR